MMGFPPGVTTTFLPVTSIPRSRAIDSAIISRNSGIPAAGP